MGERTREAVRHKRAQGERVGPAPYAYRAAVDDVHLEPEPAEQAIGSQIRALRASGHSTREIATELNRHGLATRQGTRWRFQYVARTLGSPSPELRPKVARPTD